MKMKAVVVDRFVKHYNELSVSEVHTPVISGDDVEIQVKAAGVNFVDTLYARGKHQNNRRHVRPPFTLGLEFSGIVTSSPPTSEFKPGDRVFGDYSGSFSERISVPATAVSTLHHIPERWSFVDAAGLAATLPVSYGALKSAQLQKGETVLVHAAAGGLGLAAVQIARAFGCTVIATAGSEEKCTVAKKYGADVCINYEANRTWWESVLKHTNDHGADVVFDSVGLVGLSLKCLAHRGRVLVIGFAGREGNSVTMNRVLLKQASLVGYRYGESLRRHPEERDGIWKELEPLLQQGKIRPSAFSKEYHGLESVPQALCDIASRKVWGKAAIQLESITRVDNASKSKL
ncbi:zeta-crystallin [Xylariaceae sp. FL0016]|nr:zeta-crystallin [Xylariaceae sp. FL0016]